MGPPPIATLVVVVVLASAAVIFTVLVATAPSIDPKLGEHTIYGYIETIAASYEHDDAATASVVDGVHHILREHGTGKEYNILFDGKVTKPVGFMHWRAMKAHGTVRPSSQELLNLGIGISITIPSIHVHSAIRLKPDVLNLASQSNNKSMLMDPRFILPDDTPAETVHLSATKWQSIACLIVDFSDKTSLFDSSKFTSLFWDGPENVDDLFDASSFNQVRFTRQPQYIYGPYTISYSQYDTCSYNNIRSLANAAAAAAGVDLSSFDHIVYGLPAFAACGWSGIAPVGCVNTGYYSSFTSQCWTELKSLTVSVAAHEIGHNFNLKHADIEDPYEAYGDLSCLMGIGCSCSWGHRQFNTPHVLAAGWIDTDTNVVEAGKYLTTTGSASIDVSAIEVDNAPHPYAYRFPTQASPGVGDYYYLSYRTNQKQDLTLESTYVQKTSIHRMSVDGQTFLEKVLSDSDSWSGRSGDDTFTVTQTSHTSTKATLSITGCFRSTQITISPSTRMVVKGNDAVFAVRIENANTPSCGSGSTTYNPSSSENSGYIGPEVWTPSGQQSVTRGSFVDLSLSIPVINYSNLNVGTKFRYDVVAGGARKPFIIEVVATPTPIGPTPPTSTPTPPTPTHGPPTPTPPTPTPYLPTPLPTPTPTATASTVPGPGGAGAGAGAGAGSGSGGAGSSPTPRPGTDALGFDPVLVGIIVGSVFCLAITALFVNRAMRKAKYHRRQRMTDWNTSGINTQSNMGIVYNGAPAAAAATTTTTTTMYSIGLGGPGSGHNEAAAATAQGASVIDRRVAYLRNASVEEGAPRSMWRNSLRMLGLGGPSPSLPPKPYKYAERETVPRPPLPTAPLPSVAEQAQAQARTTATPRQWERPASARAPDNVRVTPSPPRAPSLPKPLKKAEALWDYAPQHPDETRLTAGESVTVMPRVGSADAMWCRVKHSDGTTGLVPENRLRIHSLSTELPPPRGR